MIIITAAIVYVMLPALVLYLCHRFPILEKAGAALLCFVCGIVMANSGLMPGNLSGLQKTLMSVTVPLAIPLMLFPTDLRRWLKLAGKSLTSFFLYAIALMAATAAGYIAYRGAVDEADKIAGMCVGGFTGATVNFMSVAMALKAKPETIVMATAVTWFQEVILLLILMFMGQRLIGKFLRPFVPVQEQGGAHTADALSACEGDRADFASYRGFFDRENLFPLLRSLGLAVLIFGVGAALYSVSPEAHNMTVLMLTVSTLGILGSFIPSVRSARMTFQLGQYIILIFCVTIASTVRFEELMKASGSLMMYVMIILFGSALLHIVLCRIFRIDTDTQIITVIAGVFSPIFVPMMAMSLKNRDIIVGGLAAGILGYVVGTYLGISFAYVLRI